MEKQNHPQNNGLFYSPPNETFHEAGEYRPLKIEQEIRLIRIKADENPCSDVECQLVNNVSLSVSPLPIYWALSYAAGDFRDTRSIRVNGVAFNLYNNLYEALKQMQRRRFRGLLWVDQICIDQSNLPEKSQQVLQMRQIYASASKVLIWLGQSEDGRAFTFLNAVINDRHQNPQRRTSLDDMQRLLEGERAATAVVDLGLCPWFERSWVVQEAIVASSALVMYGRAKMEWELFARAMEMILSVFAPRLVTDMVTGGDDFRFGDYARFLPACRAVSQIHHDRYEWKAKGCLDLGSIIHQYRAKKATDPRDKIYAFLGLSDAEHGIVPDYNPYCSPGYVLTMVREAIITQKQRLDVLENVFEDLRAPNDSSWSWTGDGVTETSSANIGFPNPTLRERFFEIIQPTWDASRGTEAVVDFVPSVNDEVNRVLKAQIIHLGSIASGDGLATVGEMTGIHDEDFRQPLQRWCASAQACVERSNINLQGLYLWTQQSLTEAVDRTVKVILDSVMESDGRNFPEMRVQSFAARAYVNMRSAWFKFFVTPEGLIGLAPVATRGGDELCILYGARMPFVVRRLGAGDGYHLVGPAYLHGYMHGRAIEEAELGIRRATTIDLY